jgi:glycerol-3-phosphate dehydrogenase subunit C
MEGGLQKPTRFSIDWKNQDYLNEELFEKELRRVSDHCHGCRRCVSLCNSFPTLFDLIDESKTFEVDGVTYDQFDKVIDHCYLCDLCYLTKCPYVPPHDWGIDFPHLMLRGKAIKHSKSKTSIRDKILTSTDMLGKLGSRKIIAPIINYFNGIKIFRIILEKILRIHRDAKLPRFSSYTAKSKYKNISNEMNLDNKVAIFTTCYHNYNEPSVVDDLVKVLKHNNVHVELIKDDKCCGMPKLELGDLKTVEKMMEHNLLKFKKYVKDGYRIIAPVPSCVLMFKQELPLLFPENKDAQLVSKAICDPFEYLLKLHNEGVLKTDFKNDLGSVFYQVACHQRVQNIGQVTKKILELVPNTNIDALERCSGHDGTYGVKEETHKIAIKIAMPIVKEYKRLQSTQFTSDCTLAAHHVVNAMGNKVLPTHPIELMRKAYGLQ